jgi:hypothetical protein
MFIQVVWMPLDVDFHSRYKCCLNNDAVILRKTRIYYPGPFFFFLIIDKAI